MTGADRPGTVPALQAPGRLPHQDRARSEKAVMLPDGGWGDRERSLGTGGNALAGRRWLVPPQLHALRLR
jgi:hypothetical protein